MKLSHNYIYTNQLVISNFSKFPYLAMYFIDRLNKFTYLAIVLIALTGSVFTLYFNYNHNHGMVGIIFQLLKLSM